MNIFELAKARILVGKNGGSSTLTEADIGKVVQEVNGAITLVVLQDLSKEGM